VFDLGAIWKKADISKRDSVSVYFTFYISSTFSSQLFRNSEDVQYIDGLTEFSSFVFVRLTTGSQMFRFINIIISISNV
jgi:hypothetical protein